MIRISFSFFKQSVIATSAVALALTATAAEAQTRRAKQPSIEVHLEILKSLRASNNLNVAVVQPELEQPVQKPQRQIPANVPQKIERKRNIPEKQQVQETATEDFAGQAPAKFEPTAPRVIPATPQKQPVKEVEKKVEKATKPEPKAPEPKIFEPKIEAKPEAKAVAPVLPQEVQRKKPIDNTPPSPLPEEKEAPKVPEPKNEPKIESKATDVKPVQPKPILEKPAAEAPVAPKSEPVKAVPPIPPSQLTKEADQAIPPLEDMPLSVPPLPKTSVSKMPPVPVDKPVAAAKEKPAELEELPLLPVGAAPDIKQESKPDVKQEEAQKAPLPSVQETPPPLPEPPLPAIKAEPAKLQESAPELQKLTPEPELVAPLKPPVTQEPELQAGTPKPALPEIPAPVPTEPVSAETFIPPVPQAELEALPALTDKPNVMPSQPSKEPGLFEGLVTQIGNLLSDKKQAPVKQVPAPTENLVPAELPADIQDAANPEAVKALPPLSGHEKTLENSDLPKLPPLPGAEMVEEPAKRSLPSLDTLKSSSKSVAPSSNYVKAQPVPPVKESELPPLPSLPKGNAVKKADEPLLELPPMPFETAQKADKTLIKKEAEKAPEPAKKPEPLKLAKEPAKETAKEPKEKPKEEKQAALTPPTPLSAPVPASDAKPAPVSEGSEKKEAYKKEADKKAASSATQVLAPEMGYDKKNRQQLHLYFGRDDHDVSSSMDAPLKEIVKIMKSNPDQTLLMASYAGANVDDASVSKRVALSRAVNVRRYLIEAGLDASRITVQPLGNQGGHQNPERIDITLK